MRFPITLWRHIAFEVWRVVFITALVLVCVVSFAAVVKFLGEGRLGPVDALRFMAVIAVPMMHYTLPFAAGFGATLAYHRMTADGEITAAHASGIGHRWVLVPAFLAALVLGVGLGYLNQQTIPHMLRASQRMALPLRRRVRREWTSTRVFRTRSAICVRVWKPSVRTRLAKR